MLQVVGTVQRRYRVAGGPGPALWVLPLSEDALGPDPRTRDAKDLTGVYCFSLEPARSH